jgi:starvation-inducible DNA-binding protein
MTSPSGSPPSAESPREPPARWSPSGRGTTTASAALDAGYTRVIEGTRDAVTASAVNEPVTEDLLIGQLRDLEKSQWLIRAHLATIAD